MFSYKYPLFPNILNTVRTMKNDNKKAHLNKIHPQMYRNTLSNVSVIGWFLLHFILLKNFTKKKNHIN